MSLHKFCSTNQRILLDGRTRMAEENVPHLPHFPFPTSFISLNVKLKTDERRMHHATSAGYHYSHSACCHPRLLFTAIQGLKHFTGTIQNCQIQPGCTVKTIYSKERSEELGHFNQIMGNPVNSLFGKKPLHCSLNLQPEPSKHNAQISR